MHLTSVHRSPGAGSAPPAVALASDDCRKDVRLGAATGAAFIALIFGWAAFTRLDAAAYASGQVSVAGRRQTVQYRDVGVVSAIHVREGQAVKAGQILLEVSGDEMRAQERALAGQVINLLAQKVRLEAEQTGAAEIRWPVEMLQADSIDAELVKDAMAVQKGQLAVRRASLASQKALASKRIAEIDQQIAGFDHQLQATHVKGRLVQEELQGVQSLAARGFAPQSRVRNLQRDQADLTGQQGQYEAAIAQAEQQSAEARLQVTQLDRQTAEQVAAQLRDTDFQLHDLQPRWAAARQQVERQRIRAPVSGAVLGLSVTTPGAVIAPGQRLLDIVPSRPALVVEARLSPIDVNGVKVGAPVEVKFPSVHDRQLRTVHATVTRLSADAMADEKTGASYFTAEVTLTPDSLKLLQRSDQGQFALKPGVPAQVLIPLRKRTALQYLLDPLTDGIWRAFRER